jgi:hypothetical protein
MFLLPIRELFSYFVTAAERVFVMGLVAHPLRHITTKTQTMNFKYCIRIIQVLKS